MHVSRTDFEKSSNVDLETNLNVNCLETNGIDIPSVLIIQVTSLSVFAPSRVQPELKYCSRSTEKVSVGIP